MKREIFMGNTRYEMCEVTLAEDDFMLCVTDAGREFIARPGYGTWCEYRLYDLLYALKAQKQAASPPRGGDGAGERGWTPKELQLQADSLQYILENANLSESQQSSLAFAATMLRWCAKPPPATGEVVVAEAVAAAGTPLAREQLQILVEELRGQVASQQREIERLREQPSEVMFPNHPLRKDQVYTLESIGSLLDRVESLTAELEQVREALQEIRGGARANGEGWCAYRASLALSPAAPPSEGGRT